MKAEKSYVEQYAYGTVEVYEGYVGYKVNQAFRDGWDMARVTNGQLGITEPDGTAD